MSEWIPMTADDEYRLHDPDGSYFQLIQSGDELIISDAQAKCNGIVERKMWIDLGPHMRLCRFVSDENTPDLLSACESALGMLDELYPADVFTGESGDVGAALIAENRARLQAAIAKAKGE